MVIFDARDADPNVPVLAGGLTGKKTSFRMFKPFGNDFSMVLESGTGPTGCGSKICAIAR